tara:strand:- start:1 stop:420 length:420 start_codon:yes stop_codon:yes gene_type:complete
MDKKGVNLLSENVVYLLLVVLFVTSMFIGVTLVGRQVTLYEQVYAKQMALMIDKAEPGMEIEYRDFRIFKLAADNNAPRDIVSVDNDRNVVTVRLSNNQGYSYQFFNDVGVSWNIVPEDRVIFLRIIESIEEVQNEVVG